MGRGARALAQRPERAVRVPNQPPRAVVDVAVAHDRRSSRSTACAAPHACARRPCRLAGRTARVRIEHAVIDAASAMRDDVLATYRLMTDVVQTRRTTAARPPRSCGRDRVAAGLLLAMLDDPPPVRARSWSASGSASSVSTGCRPARRRRGSRVVGAPRATSTTSPTTCWSSSTAARSRQRPRPRRRRERDLDARVVEDVTTVRLTYGLVFGTPCATAAAIARLLRRGGWTGSFLRCPGPPGRPLSLISTYGVRRDQIEVRPRDAQASSVFCTLPIALRGSASTNRTSRGRLCTDSRPRPGRSARRPGRRSASRRRRPRSAGPGRGRAPRRPRPPGPPGGRAARPRPRRRRSGSRRS